MCFVQCACRLAARGLLFVARLDAVPTVADLDSQMETFFEQKNARDVPDELNSRLSDLADAYVDVDGDLKVATTTLSDDLRGLYDYRSYVAQGTAPVSSDDEELTHSAAVSSTAV